MCLGYELIDGWVVAILYNKAERVHDFAHADFELALDNLVGLLGIVGIVGTVSEIN